VIDVDTQTELLPKWNLGRFAQYLRSSRRKKVYNSISLEFSHTALSPLVEIPRIARELDWSTHLTTIDFYPKIQKYCLMSAAGSFTDFHIDFGGSSVWYHVLSGQKVFLFVEPTDTNLKAYEIWSNADITDYSYFGNSVTSVHQLVLCPGQTVFIPAGWIHAVYTPVDSLVFGGNFMHNFNIKMQLEVYALEKRTAVPKKFCVPNYEQIMWHVALALFRELSGNPRKLSEWECEGCLHLLTTLGCWKVTNPQTVPEVIENPTQLLEQLAVLCM